MKIALGYPKLPSDMFTSSFSADLSFMSLIESTEKEVPNRRSDAEKVPDPSANVSRPFALSIVISWAVTSTLLANVETPDTFKLSSSVCPSTSKSPLASIAPVKVETPDTFTLSSSV